MSNDYGACSVNNPASGTGIHGNIYAAGAASID